MIAAGRDFLTSNPWIKRVIAPFNLAVLSIFNTPCFKDLLAMKIDASVVTLQDLISAPISLQTRLSAILQVISRAADP